MHVNKHYWLIKRAVHRVAGSIGNYNPGRDESLENEYGVGPYERRGLLHNALNTEYSENDTPINVTPDDVEETDTVFEIKEMIVSKFFSFAWVCGVVLYLVSSNYAVAEIHIQDKIYNKDNNPEVVTIEERELFFAHTINFSVFEMDLDKNGIIDEAELREINKKINQIVRDKNAGMTIGIEDPTPEIETRPLDLSFVLDKLDARRKEAEPELSPEEQAKKKRRQKIEEKRLYRSEWVAYLRNQGTDVSVRADNLSKSPALFQFDYNGEAGDPSGRIQAAFGVLHKSSRKVAPGSEFYISAFTLGGSVALDRSFEPGRGEFEENTLTFRGGGDVELVNLLFPTQYLTNWIFYETDTELERKIVGVETVYQPYSFAFENGFEIGEDTLLRLSVTPTLESRYAHVLDEGSLSFSYDEYWNIGPAAQLVLRLFGDDRKLAELSSKYTHFWDATGNYEQTFVWNNLLTVPLVQQGANEISLTTGYILSEDGITGAKKNEFTAGIGWLF